MKDFKQYLKEESSTVYFTFGRMNPPTVGHEKLMDVLSKKAGSNPYRVFLSQTADPKKNPLSYTDKIKHVRKMFPRHARSVMIDKDVRTAFNAASKLYDQGFTKIAMVVGSDRVTEFKTILNKYNGQKGRHGFYNFKSIDIVSAGERDPDAEGVEGMSASKQRENVKSNNFASFSLGLPKNMSNRDAKKLFNDIRKGMGLKEQKTFKNHIELEPISETREQYVQGELYNIGDEVLIKESEESGVIESLGSNYVAVKFEDGSVKRKWLSDIQTLDEGVLASVDPITDRFLDRLLHKSKYKNALKFYMDYRKRNPGNDEQALVKAAKVTDTDFRNLRDTLNKAVKAGKLDAKYAVEEMEFEEAATSPPAMHQAKSKIQSDNVRLKRKHESEKEVARRRHDKIMDRARTRVARKKNSKERSFKL